MPSTNSNPRKLRKPAWVREMCGGISDMTLWRWLDQRDFPQPVRIARRRYWREGDVVAWLEAQRASASQAA